MKRPPTPRPGSGAQVTVTVNGSRWRQLADFEALWLATPGSRVFVLDPEAGTVRFGDGAHGSRPSAGARVRVSYRSGSGEAGNVAVTWEGRWPPRRFALATTITPRLVVWPRGFRAAHRRRGAATQ